MIVKPYSQNGVPEVEIQIGHNRSLILSEEDARSLAKAILKLLDKPPFQRNVFSFLKPAQPAKVKAAPKPPTIDQILALEDDNQIILSIHERIFQKAQKTSYESLTRVEKVVDNIWWLEAEVNNGGFHQFFFNQSGSYTYDTIESLEILGASHTRDLLLKACEVFHNGEVPSNLAERHNLLLAIGYNGNNKLNNLDGKFYEYKENLTKMLADYIKQHRDQIKL